jgi:hypothetical protein
LPRAAGSAQKTTKFSLTCATSFRILAYLCKSLRVTHIRGLSWPAYGQEAIQIEIDSAPVDIEIQRPPTPKAPEKPPQPEPPQAKTVPPPAKEKTAEEGGSYGVAIGVGVLVAGLLAALAGGGGGGSGGGSSTPSH